MHAVRAPVCLSEHCEEAFRSHSHRTQNTQNTSQQINANNAVNGSGPQCRVLKGAR